MRYWVFAAFSLLLGKDGESSIELLPNRTIPKRIPLRIGPLLREK